MSEAERLALVTKLDDHRGRMRDLTIELQSVRSLRAADSQRVEHVTSAQILQLRIKIALIESQLAAA